MSRWSDEFENHPIHLLLSQAARYLETEVEDTDAQFEDELRRLKKVFGNLYEIIQGLDNEFFPKILLDKIQEHISQRVVPHLLAFSDNPVINQLQAANDQITQTAPEFHQLAAMSRPMESQEFVEKSKQRFRSFAASMENTANKANKRIAKYVESLVVNSERAEALEHKIAGLDTTSIDNLTEWQNVFTEMQTTFEQEYSRERIERKEIFEVLMLDRDKKSEAKRTEITARQMAELEAVTTDFKEAGKAALKDVKQKHEEVKMIHKLVGSDSVAGGYQTNAGEEKKQADDWRIVSMVCLTGTAIWLVVKYMSGLVPVGDGGVNWPNVITASSLTAILVYAASYTSRQSKMHRENEKLLRSYALETTALDPFIASLEKKEQQAIKAELVRRMFGQQNAQPSGKPAKSDNDL